MRLFKALLLILIPILFVSAFWLSIQAHLRQKTEDLKEQINALLQERYEQRKEIAKYHRQEIQLWQEIARLKRSLETKRRLLGRYHERETQDLSGNSRVEKIVGKYQSHSGPVRSPMD
jgi:cell division protein FtsB